MGYDVVVQARVKLSAAALAKWKKAKPIPVKAPSGFPTGRSARTVAKVLDALSEDELTEVTDKAGAFALQALLSDEEYELRGAAIVAAANAAVPLGGSGSVVFYGFATAPEGIAYRFTLGGEFTKLSAAEEKKLATSAAAKAFDKRITRHVEEAQQARVPSGNAAFFKRMESVRPLVVDMLSWVQNADDEALVRAVKGPRLYAFFPGDFKTGARIKRACHPDGKAFEMPWLAIGDVLRLIARVDARAGEAFALRVCTSKKVPSALWEVSGELLGSTSAATNFAKAFLLRESEDANPSDGAFEDWARVLAGNAVVPTRLLESRFVELIELARTRAIGILPNEKRGAAETAAYFAAALIARKAWHMLPAIGAARFEHPNRDVRAHLGSLLLGVELGARLPAPKLSEIPRGDEGGFFDELLRRFKLDPKTAYAEVAPQLEAGDYATRADVFGALGSLKHEAQAKLYAKEPRWQAWGKKHPGA